MNTSFPYYSDSRYQSIITSFSGHHLAFGTATTIVAAYFAWYLLTVDASYIKKVRGWPLIGQWSFFTRRHDFVVDGFRQVPNESMFGFNILQHNVVAVRGEKARKTFFDRRDLSFTDGYRLLMGGGPEVKDIVKDIEEQSDKTLPGFIRRLHSLLRMDRLASLTPLFMSDLERNMMRWGTSGQFDPFDDIYSMVFQLTARAAACREIADSVESCKRMEKLYWMVEKGSTPTSVLLPWLPSRARRLQKEATAEIYNWVESIIKARRAENRREDDALQVLMDGGDSTPEIIRFILGTLFAGILNTGLMSAWIFIFLDQEPYWKAKVVSELELLMTRYAPLNGGRSYATTADRLCEVPPEAWENEMPVMEDCIRETIRLIISFAFLRRIVKGDVDVDGKTVSNGSFLVYLASETHMNPDIYTNPSKFNPGRYADGEGKSQAHGFLGWGVGRHPCAGRRFAQYEIKAICAMFLTQYEYEVVNSRGVRPDPATVVPDRNNLYQMRPKDEVFYIKYTKREQWL